MASHPGPLRPCENEGTDLISCKKPSLETEIVYGKENESDPSQQRVNQTAVQSHSEVTAPRNDALHVSAVTDVSKIPVEMLVSPGLESAICLQTNTSNSVGEGESPTRNSVFRASEADQTPPCVKNTATSVTGRNSESVEKYEHNEDACSAAPKEKLETSSESVDVLVLRASNIEVSNVERVEKTHNPTFTMVEPGEEKGTEEKEKVCAEDPDIGRTQPEGSPASTAPSSADSHSGGSLDSQVSHPHMSNGSADLGKDTVAKSAWNGQEVTVWCVVLLVFLGCMNLKDFCVKVAVPPSLPQTSKKKQNKKRKALSMEDLIASWPAIQSEKSHFKSAFWALQAQCFQRVLVYPVFPYNFQARCRDNPMSLESMRLATFYNYPHASRHSALRLANAGFFYTGQGDVLACYSCRISVFGNWLSQVQDPYMVHRHRSPICPHLSALVHTHFIQDDQRRAQSSSDITGGSAPPLQQNPGPGGGPAARNAAPHPSEAVDLRHKTYDKRLQTFGHWPRNHPISPQELAHAGFFYAGRGDLVKCFSCGLTWCGWRPGDTPLEVHMLILNPRCAFLRRQYGIEVIHRILWQGRLPAGRAHLPPQHFRHPPQPERFRCNVCMVVVVTYVFLPCGHTICHRCSARVQRCHMCRAPILLRLRIRFAPQHPIEDCRAEAYHQPRLFISLHLHLPPSSWTQVLYDYSMRISEAIVDDMILLSLPEDARPSQPSPDFMPRWVPF